MTGREMRLDGLLGQNRDVTMVVMMFSASVDVLTIRDSVYVYVNRCTRKVMEGRGKENLFAKSVPYDRIALKRLGALKQFNVDRTILACLGNARMYSRRGSCQVG